MEASSYLPVAKPPPSLPEHVRQTVREDILTGRVRPGTRLTEAAVMERTGVSRTPAREGMRMLQAEGLVVSMRGRGTYVAHQLSLDEALVIYQCRLILEPYLTRLAAERVTDHQIASIAEVLERFAAAVKGRIDGHALSTIDASFHLGIYEASGSELITLFRAYWSKLQLQLSMHIYTHETPKLFYEEHVRILEALGRRDGEAASTLMADHIAHGRRVLRDSFPQGVA